MNPDKKTSDVSRALREVVKTLEAPIDTCNKIGKMPLVPNKRKSGKEFVGGYVSKALKEKFKKVALKETGGDARKMLVKFVIEGLRKRGIATEDENDK